MQADRDGNFLRELLGVRRDQLLEEAFGRIELRLCPVLARAIPPTSGRSLEMVGPLDAGIEATLTHPVEVHATAVAGAVAQVLAGDNRLSILLIGQTAHLDQDLPPPGVRGIGLDLAADHFDVASGVGVQ